MSLSYLNYFFNFAHNYEYFWPFNHFMHFVRVVKKRTSIPKMMHFLMYMRRTKEIHCILHIKSREFREQIHFIFWVFNCF
jgi:hypothetical protein